jgi:hypothetical protein
MSRWTFAAVVLLAVGIASPVFAQDAHVGTWKLNFAKSKLVPPASGPQPQSVTRTYEMFEGDGIKATFATISADGTSTTSSYSVHFDGKDYPYTGSATLDAIAVKRIDNRSWNAANKKAGKVVSAGTNVVSQDGKTLTWTYKGTNAQGQPTSGVQVFDKQ